MRRTLEPLSSGESVVQVARSLEIGGSCLRRWMAQDAVDPDAAEGATWADVELEPLQFLWLQV